MRWTVKLTENAVTMLKSIADRRLQQKLCERIDGLAVDPDKQGKPLWGELADYRSLRAAGQRYRIIYRVDHNQVVVLVVAIGIRKEGSRADIYSLAQKLLKLGLVEAPQSEDD